MGSSITMGPDGLEVPNVLGRAVASGTWLRVE